MKFIWLIHVDSLFFNLRFFQNRIIIVPTTPSYGEDQMILFQINLTLQKMPWSRYFFPSLSTGEEAKWALRGSWRSTDLSVSGSIPEHPWTWRAFLFTWLLVAPSPGPMHAVHATWPSPLHLEAACSAFCKLPSRCAGPWGDWKSLSNPCCTGDCGVSVLLSREHREAQEHRRSRSQRMWATQHWGSEAGGDWRNRSPMF